METLAADRWHCDQNGEVATAVIITITISCLPGEAGVRVRVHEELEVEHAPDPGEVEDQDALHHDHLVPGLGTVVTIIITTTTASTCITTTSPTTRLWVLKSYTGTCTAWPERIF